MITIDKVTYRNLQEQVQKNKEDIAAWQNVEFTLNNFGIKVLGKVDSESDIPAGTYEYGDAYLVGLTDPFDLYIYTRNKEAADSGSFVNVGPLNVIGQEGPQGPQGPAGVDGYSPVVRYGNGLPIVESTDKDGYLYIDQQTSRLYTFKNNAWNYVVNMQGAKGDKGEQGIQGATGTTLSIVARLASPDLLPTNFASGAIPKNSAYLVDVQGANHLYIILGDQSDYSTWYWADAGDFNLGSVLYKDSVFQQYANITDSYDTNTGAVVTDTATNNMNNELKAQIGDLTTLGTTDKSSLVNAINEVKSSGGGASSGGMELLWSGSTVVKINEYAPRIELPSKYSAGGLFLFEYGSKGNTYFRSSITIRIPPTGTYAYTQIPIMFLNSNSEFRPVIATLVSNFKYNNFESLKLNNAYKLNEDGTLTQITSDTSDNRIIITKIYKVGD